MNTPTETSVTQTPARPNYSLCQLALYKSLRDKSIHQPGYKLDHVLNDQIQHSKLQIK